MLKNTVRAGLAATRRVIRVGGVPEHFNAPWHTAAAQGHFDAAGFEVEWTDFPGGTGAMTNALRAGEIDIALALTEGLVADLHLRETTAYKLLGTYVRFRSLGACTFPPTRIAMGWTAWPTRGTR